MAKQNKAQEKEKLPTLEDPNSLEHDQDEGGLDGEDGELDDEGEEDDGEDYQYAVFFKNGLQSFAIDGRPPEQVTFDYKVALMFPLRPDSAFTDEEQEAFQQLQKEDPRRFGEKSARAFLFELGDTIFDPREVAGIVYVEAPDEDDGGSGFVAPAPGPRDRAPAPGPAPSNNGAPLRNRFKDRLAAFPLQQ